MRWRIIALACVSSIAAAETTPEWSQEPTAVLGIKLGAPLAASPLPSCPEYMPSEQWKPPKELCIRGGDSPFGDRVRPIEGLPWKDIAITASVSLFDGKVESVYFDLRHDDYGKFKEILTTRYGPPMRRELSQVTSYAGAAVDAETLHWIGETASIVLIERSGRIDRSAANIIHNALALQAHEKRKAATEEAASKL